jgi:hypothetical protein
MNIKTIAAVGFTAASLAFGSVPASANVNVSNDALAATEGTAAREDMTASGYCGCYRGYVRYYRVYPVVRVYRVRYVRYYY